MAAQWSRQLDFSRANEVEIEVTDWAGRFAWVGQIYYRVCFCCLIRLLCSLDTIGRTAFSNDFNCLSGQPHALAEALDGLTNNENCRSSFYMRALFWIFPSILKVGKKGKMIKETRKELGEIASRLWQDAKVAGDSDNRTLMSLMRKNIPLFGLWQQTYWREWLTVKADAGTSAQRMTEEEIAAQLRSIIQAAYEPISATIAVRPSPTCCFPPLFLKSRQKTVDSVWTLCRCCLAKRAPRRTFYCWWSHFRRSAQWLSTTGCYLKGSTPNASSYIGKPSPGEWRFVAAISVPNIPRRLPKRSAYLSPSLSMELPIYS